MIVIALATHNGQKYLEKQIDSIRAQSVTDWTLIVSDDCSSDGTWELLRRLAERDQRIQLLPQPAKRLGAGLNFSRLLDYAYKLGAEYVAFSDQDDVWFSDKLEKKLSRMRTIESSPLKKRPVLVHTDAEVVDATLKTIAASHHGLNGQQQSYRNPLAHLVLHADVQGCTIMMNRPLLEFVTPIPPAAVSHDWWCSLCAAAIGTIDYLPEPTLKYRLHNTNIIGVRKKGLLSITRQLVRAGHLWQNGMTTFIKSLDQSSALLERLEQHELLDSPAGVTVETYLRILRTEASRLRRVQKLRKMQIPDVHWLRKLVSYARIMMLRNSCTTHVARNPSLLSR